VTEIIPLSDQVCNRGVTSVYESETERAILKLEVMWIAENSGKF